MPRKRNFRRKRGNRRNVQLKRRPNLSVKRYGFPDKLMVDLKFSQNMEHHIPSTGYSVTSLVRGNDPYDPFVGLLNHSANEYAIYAGIYRYCKVVASFIKFTVIAFEGGPTQVILVPHTTVTNLGANSEITQRYAKSTKFIRGDTTRPGPGSTTISHFMRTNKIFGIPSLKYDIDGEYAVDNLVNPFTRTVLKPWYWHVMVAKSTGTWTGACEIHSRIEVIYKCVFWHKLPQVIATSGNTGTHPAQVDDSSVPIGVTGAPAA